MVRSLARAKRYERGVFLPQLWKGWLMAGWRAPNRTRATVAPAGYLGGRVRALARATPYARGNFSTVVTGWLARSLARAVYLACG